MQKLQLELKNVPTDASQVCSSTNSGLNRDQSLSVQDIVLDCNSPEVNQRKHISDRSLRVADVVYVLNQRSKPLMPTTSSRARKLLNRGEAIVVKRKPFTIKLLKQTGEDRQYVELKVDSGAKYIGISVTTKIKELIAAIVLLDLKTKERLDERRMYRRLRRNKLWYRKPRFNNRVRREGWLPPSVQRKLDAHIRIIEKIKNILPITKVIIEVGNFDIQKINNPEISGIQYQQGNLYGYQNMRSYLMFREKGKCQYCGKNFKNSSSHMHHIISRPNGTDKENNLALLHKKCHKKLHSKKLFKKFSKNKQYKESTFMSIIQHRLKFIADEITYGYETFIKRNILKLPKTHNNDAFVIGNGKDQLRFKCFDIIQKHRNNRVLQLNRKGFKPSIKKKRSIINPKDLFWVNNTQYVCKGMFNKGKYILFGDSKKREYFKTSLIEKYYNFGSFAWNI